MKRILAALTVICCLNKVKAQQKINVSLKHELDSMYVLDQKYRAMVSEKLDSNKVDSLIRLYHVAKDQLSDKLWQLQTEADSSNVKRVEQIIKQYGYPGKSMVDTPTNEAVFYVLQHSTKIDFYLPLVEKAAKEKELPFRLYAMMKDRSLMYNGMPQIWGTQAKGMNVTDKQSGKRSWKFFIWPIGDPANVNKRRKEAGFEQTVEQNAERMGLTYKPYTLEQVKQGTID